MDQIQQALQGLSKTLSDLATKVQNMSTEMDNLRQRRIGQADYIPDSVKMRHMGEGNRYIQAGLEANLPVGVSVTSSVGQYFATDTDTLWIWNGTTWVSFSGADSNNFLFARKTVADAAYPILTTDYLIAYTSLTSGRTATLPTAVGATRQVYVIKDESGGAATNNITIACTGGQTIDGSATKTINSNYGSLSVYSNGAVWFSF